MFRHGFRAGGTSANGGTARLRVGLPEEDIERIDALVEPGFYANRGDFLRSAVRAQIAAHAGIMESIAAAQAAAAGPRRPERPAPRERLLELLRCPECGEPFADTAAADTAGDRARENGGAAGPGAEPHRLTCPGGHSYPVVAGIPRIYPGADDDFAGAPGAQSRGRHGSAPGGSPPGAASAAGHERTRRSFAREWAHHRLGDPTWYVDTPFRVGASFLHPLRIPQGELAEKIVLDIGCGNGSQSVAYADHVAEVIAVDLSTGVDLGKALLEQQDGPAPNVHFVQADLHRTPLPPASVDIIHAHGVLHHTPDTRAALSSLTPLLRPGGTCYVWLYSDGFVTPFIRLLRRLTTRTPLPVLDRCSRLLAPAFALAVAAQNKSGIKSLPPMDRRAAALTLLDVFGPPHMHHHTAEEVMGWFGRLGFTEVWSCLHSKRGFAVCGRLPSG